MKIKIGLITKNIFYLNNHFLISNNFLFDKDVGIFGFKLNEIEKLVLIGFNENDQFDGYCYDLNKIKEVFVIGPKFKKEKRYILDRVINIFRTLKELYKKREIIKDLDVIIAPFFEYIVFEFLFLKVFAKNVKLENYIIADYPERNYQKNRNIFLKNFLIFSQKLVYFLSNENWSISKKIAGKYNFKKIKIIYNPGLKRKFIKEKPQILGGEIRLCFAGRLEQDKRPLILPDILNCLISKNYCVKLTIIGDGPLKESFFKKIKELNLDNFLTFYGWIKEREKYFKILSEQNIFLLPSIEGEGLPLVLSEALGQGLVIIATKSGDTEEIIQEGKNGFLVELERDEIVINKFVEKIEFLINNPDIYTQISQNNLERAKEWTVEKFAKQQKSELLKLIDKK